jgi:DSF synthase
LNTAKSLCDLGVVDELCRSGEGVHAANQYIRHHERSRNGQQAIQMVRQRVFPLEYQELVDIVDIWVDAALRLTARDLRMMGKFINAQSRLERANAGMAVKTAERNEAIVYPHPAVAAAAGV